MTADHTTLVLAALTFVLAGLVKGVTGMGLPTVAIGLLGLVMAPAEAAALLITPRQSPISGNSSLAPILCCAAWPGCS